MNVVPAILILSQSQYDRRVTGTSPVAEADGTIEGIQMLNANANAFQNFKYGTNTGSFVNTTSNYGPAELAIKDLRDWAGEDQIHVVQVSKSGVSLHPTSTVGGSPSPGAFFYDTQQVVAGNRMFDMQFSRIRTAHDILAGQQKYIDWKCVLVAQGESDKGAPYNALYSTYFPEWMRRTDNLCGVVLKKHILGVTSSSMYYDSIVRTAQTDFQTANSGTTRFLNTNGFGMQADNAHYNAAGVQSIREDLFDWMKTIW